MSPHIKPKIEDKPHWCTDGHLHAAGLTQYQYRDGKWRFRYKCPKCSNRTEPHYYHGYIDIRDGSQAQRIINELQCNPKKPFKPIRAKMTYRMRINRLKKEMEKVLRNEQRSSSSV